MSAVNHRKYPCRHYSRGYCHFGDSCGFYHDPNLKYHNAYEKSRYTYDGSRIENPYFVLAPEIHQVPMEDEDPGDEIVVHPEPIVRPVPSEINLNLAYCFNCAEPLSLNNPNMENYCNTCNAIRRALDTICVTCANTKRYYDYSLREVRECPDCSGLNSPHGPPESGNGGPYGHRDIRSITELYSPVQTRDMTELSFSPGAWLE